MMLLIFSIIALSLLQAKWTAARSSNQVRRGTSVNCSKYVDDSDVLASFPYTVHINPFFKDNSKTYACRNTSGNIDYMNIANQKSIPPIIYCLKHLQRLKIRNTSFSDSNQRLPAAIKRFRSSLIELGIFNTKITQLPVQIGKLSHLNILQLSNTGLISLPNSIGNLLSLTSLLLPNNNLTILPPTITNLRSLTYVQLTNNEQLRSIQELNGFPSLQGLDVRDCSIERLPLNLPNLTDLYMTNNRLTNLIGIHTLGTGTSYNKSFAFDMNQIQSIPPEILYVNNLDRLNMNGNKLDNLPSNIFSIATLRCFYIKSNRFHLGELKQIEMKFKKTNPNFGKFC